jgi:starch synthase
MECKRVALIFQGTVNNDARVRREIESISNFAQIDVFSSDVRNTDVSYFSENVKLIPFKLIDSWINKNFSFSKQFLNVKGLLDPLQYDVVICIDYPTLKIGVELKKNNPSLKLIYDSHEIYVETIGQFFPAKGARSIYGIPMIIINKIFHRRLEKKLISKVDICITVCESLKFYFEKLWSKKVYVLRNCPHLMSLNLLPIDENPYTAQYGCAKTDRILLYQGNINNGRGLFQVIKAMVDLPSQYKLFIIGSGMLKNDLEQLAESLNLHSVFFIDRLAYEDMFNYTRYSHLGISMIEPINLSKRLSLPNKLFEYMYCGVPFLSSDLPEPNYLLKFVDAGYICPGFEIEIIKETIEKVFANEDLYKIKSMNAKEAISNSLNWENEFKSLIGLIDTNKE